MIKFPAKLSTEELAERLRVTPQTVNRWIKKLGWRTEPIPGVKGGRARVIFMTPDVVEYIANTPAVLDVTTVNQIDEPARTYSTNEADRLWQQNADILQNLLPIEQQRLNALLKREGIVGFISRLGLSDKQA
ncbi:YfeC-like transcriptional regulator [Kluyvera sp. STS39-E]|uniref:YfeC-like transcriptional regulator n=1 Tax=Kluyvera sp. STS39-E TaxID=3234748 RepID=UPI0034C631DE